MDHPFDTTGLHPEEIDQFHEIYAALKQKYPIELTGHIDFHLEQFEIFKHYLHINVRDSYAIKNRNNDGYILFVESLHKQSVHGKVSEGIEYQTWAIAYLKHDFGRVLIRRETLVDKIIELIHPVELDLKEDKIFSDAFYVHVNDHYKAISGLDRSFRNVVMDIRLDDLVIEIVEHTLIIGSVDPLSPEKAIHLADFVSRLCTTCD